MIDAGVNLLDKRFEAKTLIQEAYDAGVTGIIVIASSIDESIKARDFCSTKFACPISLKFTAGVHPHHAKEWSNDDASVLLELSRDKHFAAIGECGLDFNRNFSSPQQQRKAFLAQLEIANDNGLGLYLHERDALEEQINLLKGHAKNAKFLFTHCFTGGKAALSQYLALGSNIGITGWVCDPKRGKELREALPSIPLQNLLIETDAPYLFPKTLRPSSRNNHPKNVFHISEKIAEILGESADKIRTITSKNAESMFDLNGLKYGS